MVYQATLYSGFALIIVSIILILFGHRVCVKNFFLSIITIMIIALTAWLLQKVLIGHALPWGLVLCISVLVGGVISALFENWNPIGHATFTIVVLAATTFLIYACYVILWAKLGVWSLVFAFILWTMEVGALVLLIAHTFEIIDVVCRVQWRRIGDVKVVPDYTPKVSLHVPIHNEPPELVIETLNALARLNYSDYEVLVIDNNTSDEELWKPVEAHCAQLGSRFRFFHLMPWPGYKSGALNFALSETAPEADIIGIVDADYIIEQNFLAHLVGHFANPRVSFVQTPQDYRDPDMRGRLGKALYLAYMYFFKISMATRNEHNAIIFAGTMGLIRRAALEAIGGWDEWCITEDAELSLRLLDAGYNSVYVDITYGRGLMPLDYSGIKKQRFRWAFGGMQILRMHANRLFNPWSSGHLNFAQRFAYLNGVLQWLNDPLALSFTLILWIGAGSLVLGNSLFIQPLVGATILMPSLFILFAVTRFLWAFRIRARCSLRDAFYALIVLLGLSWVVTLACFRGLLSKKGVFLRTPKQGERPTLIDSFRVVKWELLMSFICMSAVCVLILTHSFNLLSLENVIVVFLIWQFIIYMSAVQTSIWSYLENRVLFPHRWRLTFRNVGHKYGRFVVENKLAAVIASILAVLLGLFFISVISAPLGERIMRADPLKQFIPARSVLPVALEEQAASILVREAAAARRGDVESALSLWYRNGVIVDKNFTPDFGEDDTVWEGLKTIRKRYIHEFQERQYKRLRHKNLKIHINNNEAFITNDLDALIKNKGQVRHIYLRGKDFWVLRQFRNEWKIVRLEVNRTQLTNIAK